MQTATMNEADAKELAKIEKKLEAAHKKCMAMDFGNSTDGQRVRIRTQINELCMDRNRLLGLGVRDRVGDRRI